MRPRYQDEATIRAALAEPRIAVVGLSANPARDSHEVAAYLQRHGYRVIPVNPNETEVLGEVSYPSLRAAAEAVGPIGLVEVFRRPTAAPQVAREAVATGARFLWLQFGVISQEAADIAEAGGVRVIMDRCIKVDHAAR